MTADEAKIITKHKKTKDEKNQYSRTPKKLPKGYGVGLYNV